MKKIILICLSINSFFLNTKQFCNETNSEFIVVKENKSKISLSKLKESIAQTYADILKVGLNLSKSVVDLQEFALFEIESLIQEGSLNSSNKMELKNYFDELADFKKNLEGYNTELKKKLSKFKNKFKFHQKN